MTEAERDVSRLAFELGFKFAEDGINIESARARLEEILLDRRVAKSKFPEYILVIACKEKVTDEN